MTHRTFALICGLGLSVGLAGCGVGTSEPTHFNADGQIVQADGSPLAGGTPQADGRGQASVGCPAGATLVTTPSGARSCAHTAADAELITGTEPVTSPAVRERLSRRARETGKPVAYTDGVHTVTTFPPT